MYPMHGAGVIDAIEHCEIMGEDKMYYVLKMPMGDLKVMIPVEKAKNIGLRDVIGEGELREVEEVLEGKPEYLPGSWNKRLQANLDRMKSGNICDVAAVARNLIVQNRKRKVSSGERRLMDLARRILVSELVFAREETPEEVEAWMAEILGQQVADA